MSTPVVLPAEAQRVDATGHVWTFLDGAAAPETVRVGAVLVSGEEAEPFFARVVDIVDGPEGRAIVHLDVVGPVEE